MDYVKDITTVESAETENVTDFLVLSEGTLKKLDKAAMPSGGGSYVINVDGENLTGTTNMTLAQFNSALAELYSTHIPPIVTLSAIGEEDGEIRGTLLYPEIVMAGPADDIGIEDAKPDTNAIGYSASIDESVLTACLYINTNDELAVYVNISEK